jgi:hypothetical protein
MAPVCHAPALGEAAGSGYIGSVIFQNADMNGGGGCNGTLEVRYYWRQNCCRQDVNWRSSNRCCLACISGGAATQ